MKKTLVLMSIFFLIILFTACGNNIPQNTSVNGTIKLVKGDYSSPLTNAIVSINNNETNSSENGSYSITNLEEGMSNINVFVKSENNTYTQSIDTQQTDDSKILVWSKDVNLDSGDNLINISVSPLGEVLKIDQSKWQLAFYATPPSGKKIIEGSKIIVPNGTIHKMEEHFGSQWHQYFSITEPLPGYFKYEINFDDDSQEIFKVYISEDDFDIAFPNLNYPINYTVIDSTTPTFEYNYSSTADKAYLRIEEKILEDEWDRKEWISVSNNTTHKIESGILKRGKDYRWTIQSVFKTKVFPWTEAKAPYKYFSVAQ